MSELSELNSSVPGMCRVMVEMYRRLLNDQHMLLVVTVSLAVQVHWSRSLSVHFPSV